MTFKHKCFLGFYATTLHSIFMCSATLFIRRHLKYFSNDLLNVPSNYRTTYSKKVECSLYSVVFDPKV